MRDNNSNIKKQSSHQFNEKNVNPAYKNPHWLKELMTEAIKNSNFESKLIEEYYLEISIPYIKKVLRASLLILITYIYLTIYWTSIYNSNRKYTMIGQIISLYILLICFASTLFIETHRNHVRISMLALLTVVLQNMLTSYDIKSKMEITYSPILQMLVLVFTFIPLNFAAAISISLLTICFLILATMMRISILKITSQNGQPENRSILQALTVNPVMPHDFDMISYVGGQVLLWIAAYLSAFYMFTCNRLWRQSAFVTLGENVQAKRKSKHAMKGQLRWIEAIMPAVVKDEYWAHNQDIKANKWVYIKAFDNVSILFADIVGFTNMSSNKTAPQVVTLLNDLFNRFDELCNITNCEKLGTLGDCYYCVAGCPLPRPDHAVSCIEMGLGMCRIIKQFNSDHKEDVNMRVGVHTGRVNAAIIGKQRFRFDVYSNDVIIANTMESSGKPGQVHISQSVYELIRHAYNVTPGDNLEIKREEDHGIAGMLLKSFFINTYFVDPNSSHLKKKGEKFGKKGDFHVLDAKAENDDSDSESEFGEVREDKSDVLQNRMSFHKKSYMARIDEEVAFIETLRYDPDQQIVCFYEPPINVLTLMFYDPEVEWHFQNHTIDHVQSLSLYSAKLAPIVECIVSLICTIFICLAVMSFFHMETDTIKNMNSILGLFGLTISLIVIEFWKSSTYYSLLSKRFEKIFYSMLCHQLYRSIICVYMTILPSIMCFMMVYNCHRYNNEYYFQARYFSLNLFSFINGSLFVSAWTWVKVFALTLNFAQSLLFGLYFTCDSDNNKRPLMPYYTCLGHMNLNKKVYNDLLLHEYFYQYLFTFLILVVLVRERERNLRIWFYVSREAEIGREEALQAMRSSQELLYNIIPKYVFDYVKQRGGENIECANFNYALAIPRAGVVFACISNFFSKYYREDYKGGGNALKLLHDIIMKFDHLLMDKQYKDVEKIKTINDCYMLASGLNASEIEFHDNKLEHLVSLMNYAFDMQKMLTNFNEHYIIGNDKFEIKIGYNYGPVTAGIIGSTKPMYDIWGDTVNVSSRMYSTGKPGEIQVPHYVAEELKSYFDFKYRGKIFVKGKGDMNTYLCVHPIKRVLSS